MYRCVYLVDSQPKKELGGEDPKGSKNDPNDMCRLGKMNETKERGGCNEITEKWCGSYYVKRGYDQNKTKRESLAE